MIRPLRRRHRHMVIVLCVFLPVAFGAGIAARKPAPAMDSLPRELAGPPQNFAVTEWERADLWRKTPMLARLLRERAGAGRFAVEFSPAGDFVKPDLIVYWVPGNPAMAEKVPEDARLIGAFNPSFPLPLPPGAISGSGVLVLYSLADQEIVEVSKPFALQKP